MRSIKVLKYQQSRKMSEACENELEGNCDKKKEDHNLQVYENFIILRWLKWKYWNVYS